VEREERTTNRKRASRVPGGKMKIIITSGWDTRGVAQRGGEKYSWNWARTQVDDKINVVDVLKPKRGSYERELGPKGGGAIIATSKKKISVHETYQKMRCSGQKEGPLRTQEEGTWVFKKNERSRKGGKSEGCHGYIRTTRGRLPRGWKR